jgi:hypothetical protein
MDLDKLQAIGKTIGQVVDNLNLRIEGEIHSWEHSAYIYSTPKGIVLDVEERGVTVEVPHIGAVRDALRDLSSDYIVSYLDSGDWSSDLAKYEGNMALKVSRTSEPETSVIFYNWSQICDALIDGSLEDYLSNAFK